MAEKDSAGMDEEWNWSEPRVITMNNAARP